MNYGGQYLGGGGGVAGLVMLSCSIFILRFSCFPKSGWLSGCFVVVGITVPGSGW